MDTLQDLETAEAIFANALLEKELEMLSRLLKSFGMKDVKAVVDAYPCDGYMAKKRTITELRLGLVQIPVPQPTWPFLP